MHIFKLGILYYLQAKRGHDYIPRLGRGSTPEEEDNSAQLRNQNTPLFAPRLGKKSLEFSPRLGRSYFSGNNLKNETVEIEK